MNITLTPEQILALVKPIEDRYDIALKGAKAKLAKESESMQRKANTKLNAANQRASEWKQSYQAARKNLLAAQAEITDLKRRLRNGEWND